MKDPNNFWTFDNTWDVKVPNIDDERKALQTPSPQSDSLNTYERDPSPREFTIIERFKMQQTLQRVLFAEKHSHYGASNILDGDHTDPELIKESLHSLYVRMRDKLNRFKVLIDNPNTSDESMRDTLNDLSNYSNIAIIVAEGTWNDNH